MNQNIPRQAKGSQLTVNGNIIIPLNDFISEELSRKIRGKKSPMK